MSHAARRVPHQLGDEDRERNGQRVRRVLCALNYNDRDGDNDGFPELSHLEQGPRAERILDPGYRQRASEILHRLGFKLPMRLPLDYDVNDAELRVLLNLACFPVMSLRS